MARDMKQIQKELVLLLGISPAEAELYIDAIGGERIDRRMLEDRRIRDAVGALSARGMMIRAGKGDEFIPVHPRLALSNLFRIYEERMSRERRERRLSVDRLALELVPIYEKTKDTNASPGEEANNE